MLSSLAIPLTTRSGSNASTRRRGPVSKKSRTNQARKSGITSRRVPRGGYFSTHISAMPQKFHSKMNWHSAAPFALVINTFTEVQTVTLNGLFNVSGGVSPLGFTKMMAFYSKYAVQAARITIDYANIAGNQLIPAPVVLEIGATITTNATAFTNVKEAVGTGLSKYALLTNAPGTCKISMGCDMNKFLGTGNLEDSGGQYNGTVGANPAQVVVCHIWAIDPSTTQSGGVYVTATVEFDVVFYDPIPFV